MMSRLITDFVLLAMVGCGIGVGQTGVGQTAQTSKEPKAIRWQNPKRARVSGRLIDATGKPVADVQVYLFPTKRSDVVLTDNLGIARYFSDKDGRFSIDYVGSGRAVFGVFEYGSIKKIQIRAGRNIELGTFVIQAHR
jgi:hypothetical protein